MHGKIELLSVLNNDNHRDKKLPDNDETKTGLTGLFKLMKSLLKGFSVMCTVNGNTLYSFH